MDRSFQRVVVIGAGTMGGGIAAHIANAGVPVTLLDIVPPDLEAAGGDRNAIVNAGWQRVLKSRPAALMHPDNARLVRLGNLEDDFDAVGEAELVIEAIVERLDVKQRLMARLDEARAPDAIVTTNTSGIPISEIQEGRSEGFREHFCGTHFFNPPRYLKLLEIIPGPDTRPEVVSRLRRFAEGALGKGVVIAKDRPGFVANRVGTWAGQHRVNWIVENGYGVEEIDAMAGPFIGNPKSGVFKLLDIVGLDVAMGVADNLFEALPEDEHRDRFNSPEIIRRMVEAGALGRKAGVGFYRREGKAFHPIDLESGDYVEPTKPRFDLIGKLRRLEPLEARIRAIFEADPEDRVARFWRETTLPVLAYASKRIPGITASPLEIDRAMRWGFAQALGPFEAWDAIGVADGVAAIRDLGWEPAPWVDDMIESGAESFYRRNEAGRATHVWSPERGDYIGIEPDPREISIDALRADGRELERNPSASLLDMGDGVLLFEFHAKMNALDDDITRMGFTALDYLERPEWRALVVGNQGENFCVGANIAAIGMAAAGGQIEPIRAAVEQLHELLMRFRFSPKPVVTAPFGMTLGGGAEVAMHGSRIVAAAESYIGLVEVGVGLIPGAGGVKELVRRVVSPAMAEGAPDPIPYLQRVFETVALAKVATSAQEARAWGFLSESDRIVMNADHLLHEARRTALEMADEGYTPPPRDVPRCYASGANALAALRAAVFGMVQGRYASEHDALIADKLAVVLCGGPLSEPQWLPEDYFNRLETDAFVELVQQPRSLERIMHMLQTGKPLRN